jgi:hypothetical protein
MSLRILTLLLLSVVYALPVTAADVDARGSVRGDGRYHTEEYAVVIDGRVDFEVDIGPFSFGGAYRAYDFGENDYNPRSIDPGYDIWHRYVEGRTGGLFFRGGHFFSTFGRGLVLRSFEDINLEHDTALDGFIAEYETQSGILAGLAGEATERLTDIRRRVHKARGARVQGSLGSQVSLAVSGLDRSSATEDDEISVPDSLSRFGDYLFGTEAEVWFEHLSVAAEYAYRDGAYYPELKQGETRGHGAYLSGTVTTTWSTLLAEYKDYDKFEHALINPPTCVKDHLWILMNRVTHQVDLGDERGFLVEGTLMPSDAYQITGGASEARTQGGSLAHWEIFGQFDNSVPRWGISSVACSWSREYIFGKFTEYITGVIDLEFDAGALEVLEIEFEAQSIEEPSGEAYEDYLASIAVYPGEGLTLSAVSEVTTEETAERDFWLFGDIRATIADGLEISLGGGIERGGKKCSGGICFTEPEFTGVRLKFLTYF